MQPQPQPSPRTRVALYARFSTDLQRQTSIVDQLVAARARAADEGWPVVVEHADEQVSGSVPFALRPGSKALLADALAKRFDVLIIEGLDRAFRDLGEQELIVKRIEHRGIRIIGTSDGYDTLFKGRKVMRVARGLVNEMYLDDLRDKTHRGLAGQFGRGFSAGGRSFGYSTEAVDGGRRIVIDEAEAAHVRWVFKQAAEGRSTRFIAHALNARGIASPRGGTWAVSAVFGGRTQGLGLLNNALYVGRVIWNRRQWVKDPETGKRRYVERPRTEWLERDAPELRIVSQELWDAVQARRNQRSGRRPGQPAKTLFGGLLACPVCGGAIVAVSALRYACAAHKDRGSTVCPSTATFRRDAVDRRLVAELRGELLAPSALAELQRELRELIAEHSRAAGESGQDERKRLRELDREIERLVDAIAAVGLSAAVAARLKAAELERARLEVSARPPPLPPLVENVIARYRRQVMQLRQALEEESDREHTREILAELIGRVRLVRDEATGESYAEIQEPAERLLLATVGESPILVARAGFEPATFGL